MGSHSLPAGGSTQPKQSALDKFVLALQQDPGVAVIFVFGSFARGDSRPESDIDLLVITGGTFRREVVQRDGVEFEIFYNNTADTIAFWSQNRDDFANFWRDARVLFDRDGTAAHLARAAAALRA